MDSFMTPEEILVSKQKLEDALRKGGAIQEGDIWNLTKDTIIPSWNGKTGVAIVTHGYYLHIRG